MHPDLQQQASLSLVRNLTGAADVGEADNVFPNIAAPNAGGGTSVGKTGGVMADNGAAVGVEGDYGYIIDLPEPSLGRRPGSSGIDCDKKHCDIDSGATDIRTKTTTTDNDIKLLIAHNATREAQHTALTTASTTLRPTEPLILPPLSAPSRRLSKSGKPFLFSISTFSSDSDVRRRARNFSRDTTDTSPVLDQSSPSTLSASAEHLPDSRYLTTRSGTLYRYFHLFYIKVCAMATSIFDYVTGLYETLISGRRKQQSELEFQRRYEDWVRHQREVLGGY